MRLWWWTRLAFASGLGAFALLAAVAPKSHAVGSSHARAQPVSAAPGLDIPQPVARLTKPPFGPGPGDETQKLPSSPALVLEGYGLYQESCASCHGLRLRGIKSVAPSLIGVGAGPPLFYLTSGRMPLQAPTDEPLRARPLFNRQQIDAIVDYITTFGGPRAPAADPAKGNLATGFELFTLNCAGCHQIVARGGITVGAAVPDLMSATPDQIAEAVRMGPYLMPRFSPEAIDQHGLDSIARYIRYARHPDNAGGWGIYNIGPIPEGIVAWFIGLAALLLVARLIGERTA